MKNICIVGQHLWLIILFWVINAVNHWSILNAQDPGHWTITDEDGLPSMTIYRIIQDSEGYIWLATANGLCKYDGKNFKTFSKKGLKDGEILKVAEGPRGKKWFRNLSGQIGYVQGEELILLNDILGEDINSSDFNFTNNSLFLVRNNEGKSSLLRIRLNKDGTIGERTSYFESSLSMTSFAKNQNHLYCKTIPSRNKSSTPFTIDIITDSIKMIENFGDRNSINFVSSSQKENTVLTYNYSQNEIIEITPNRKTFLVRLPINNNLNRAQKNGDEYAILTKNGIILGKNPPFDDNDLFFKNISCNTLLLDREKTRWIGTSGQGVIVIPYPMLNNFNADNSQIINTQVTKLFLDKEVNKLIVGQMGAKISIINSQKEISSLSMPSSGKVTSIIKDRDKKYLVSTDLHAFQTDINFKKFHFKIAGYKTALEDSFGDLWFGDSNSVYSIDKQKLMNLLRMNPENNSILIFQSKNIKIKQRTYALFEDIENTLWVGSSRGIYFKKDDTLVPFLENEIHIPYNVSEINQSQDSTIWVTTLGNGVLGIKNGRVVKNLNDTNGFISDAFKAMDIDGDILWLASDNGINSYNLKDGSINLINKTDGLPTNDINDILVWENDLWVATNRGLTSFPKNINTTNKTTPPIKITGLKIWDKDTTLADTLKLPYDRNNLQLEYIGLGFRAQGNISYRYKMSGIDKDWVKTDTRFVRYPSLNSGTYLFEVQSINEDGVKSESPASILISIATPWWKTWWFYILSTLSIIGLVSFIIYRRIQRLRNEEKKDHDFKERLNELKQLALQTQMNPHFIFNSLNAIQQFITTNDREPALIYLSSFAKLVRLIFEHSKKKVISFDEEIEFLRLYLKLEKLRFKEKVDIDLKLSEEVESESYQIKVPPLLFQPLIENSFKHGLFHKKQKGNLKIHFQKNKEYLTCEIEDDGVGRKKAALLNHWKTKKYESSGIKTAQERLNILNDIEDPNDQSSIIITDLMDAENNPAGTRIFVQIKC